MQQRHLPSVSYYNVLYRMLILYRRVQQQEQFFAKNLERIPAGMPSGKQDLFSPRHIKRYTKYWQLGLNLVCGNVYQLTGNTLNNREQQRIILLSVFGPLFDDLFDDHGLSYAQITELVTKPETYVPFHETDRFAADLYLTLLKDMPNRLLFVEQLQAVAYWQNESLKQLQPNLTEQELLQITYKKSYYAVLLFCAVLDNYPNEAVQQLLYPVAGLMQLTNDAFDVYKDMQAGVYTLPNQYRNFEGLQQQFMKEVASINQQLGELPYSNKAKRAFAITVHSLHAMGCMALEQLQEVSKGTLTFEEFRSLSRKALVCDMDSMKQKVKWLRQISRLCRYAG